jgi:hypothetical protein
MRPRIRILGLAVLMGLAACRSQQRISANHETEELRLEQQAEVPMPSTTPFDSSPPNRAAYLEFYAYGYRSGLVALNVLFHKPEPTDAVRTQGWQDGASAGLSAHITEVKERSQ